MTDEQIARLLESYARLRGTLAAIADFGHIMTDIKAVAVPALLQAQKDVDEIFRSSALAEAVKAETAPETPWYPDDDPRWREHTPGDPMPCGATDTIVYLRGSDRAARRKFSMGPCSAFQARWAFCNEHDTVAWRLT